MFITRSKRKSAAFEAIEFRCACMRMEFSESSAARQEQPTLPANSACELLRKLLYLDRGRYFSTATAGGSCRGLLGRQVPAGSATDAGSRGAARVLRSWTPPVAVTRPSRKPPRVCSGRRKPSGRVSPPANRRTSRAPCNWICLLSRGADFDLGRPNGWGGCASGQEGNQRPARQEEPPPAKTREAKLECVFTRRCGMRRILHPRSAFHHLTQAPSRPPKS
jgi:hypothetical protein